MNSEIDAPFFQRDPQLSLAAQVHHIRKDSTREGLSESVETFTFQLMRIALFVPKRASSLPNTIYEFWLRVPVNYVNVPGLKG